MVCKCSFDIKSVSWSRKFVSIGCRLCLFGFFIFSICCRNSSILRFVRYLNKHSHWCGCQKMQKPHTAVLVILSILLFFSELKICESISICLLNWRAHQINELNKKAHFVSLASSSFYICLREGESECVFHSWLESNEDFISGGSVRCAPFSLSLNFLKCPFELFVCLHAGY